MLVLIIENGIDSVESTLFRPTLPWKEVSAMGDISRLALIYSMLLHIFTSDMVPLLVLNPF